MFISFLSRLYMALKANLSISRHMDPACSSPDQKSNEHFRKNDRIIYDTKWIKLGSFIFPNKGTHTINLPTHLNTYHIHLLRELHHITAHSSGSPRVAIQTSRYPTSQGPYFFPHWLKPLIMTGINRLDSLSKLTI